MTTLAYKLFELGLRVTRYRNRILHDIQKDRIGSARPKGQYAERFERSDFKGQTLWTIHPKSGPSKKRYVHFHGGAYVYRVLDVHFPTIAELADESGITIILPDYPIFPKTAEQTHEWSYELVESFIMSHGLGNVIIGGCSAGGNLALAVLQLRRDTGLENPKDCILWSPWVDLSMERGPKPNGDKEPLISTEGIVLSAERFAKGRDAKDPLISPVFGDLNNLADFHIFTGAKDLLYPDIDIFADKAREAGRLKSYKVEPDFGHYWMFYPTKDRRRTIAETAEVLRQ